MMRRWVALAICLFIGFGMTPAATGGLTFPNDHGSHLNYPDERWRFSGHLKAADGSRFDYALTFFRLGIAPHDTVFSKRGKWSDRQLYSAVLAITDEREQRFYSGTRFARGALGLGGAISGALSLHVDDWSVRGEALQDRRVERMTVRAKDGSAGLELTESPLKPPVLDGRYGYSYTRLMTEGTLTYGGRAISVQGFSWMDHEFGAGTLSNQAGWDRFSIQLDDGRDLMLLVTRRKDGVSVNESRGILVNPDGKTFYLSSEDFSLSVRGGSYWRSSASHAKYPSLWVASIPGAHLFVSLAPVVFDQEVVAAPHEHGISFWSGAIDVAAPFKRSGNSQIGRGYAELVGYAR